MATHAVLIKNRVAASDVDAYNRSAIAGSAVDIDNSYIFRLDSQSTTAGESELWSVTAVSANGSTLDNVWMASSPEVVLTVVGSNYYKGIDVDPRNFYNIGGKPFDAFKPQVGDVITVTAAGITGSPSTGTYVCSQSGSYLPVWSATKTASSFAAKLLQETYISIGTGAIDTQRVLAYKLQVLAN